MTMACCVWALFLVQFEVELPSSVSLSIFKTFLLKSDMVESGFE